MNVPKRKCQLCGAETELLYKVYDNSKVSHDVPICVNCLMDIVTSLINNFPKRVDDKDKPRHQKQRLYDILGEDEAIAVFTEFADIKIQNIGVQGHCDRLDHGGWHPKRLFALVIRSLYNNQWRMRIIDADIPVDEMMETCRVEMNEIFKDSRYPEDMV